MKFLLLCLGLMHYASSHSLTTLEDLELADDTWSVGSYVREVRAAAPDDHYNRGESDGEVGYSRKKEGGGQRGYQSFDTFQKKSGDNYAIAKEDSFGYDDEGQKGQEGAYSQKHEKKVKSKEERKPEPADKERTDQKERLEKLKDTDTTDFTKHRHYEELKEGASDGNGGVEAHGHDRRDYILPEKYTWGKDDEYTF